MMLDSSWNLPSQTLAYGVDTFQRWMLFLDTLRERGNIYREHLMAGKPPVLCFDHELVRDGVTLAQPANFQLLRIHASDGTSAEPGRRPIVVIDPRAGHGPGIGGYKLDSEIGIALANGHPVYFITFGPKPVPGQTITHVLAAETQFIDQVAKMHPRESEPVVIGNCQAGWALALLGADRPDVTGPMVLAGAPLSYWAGAGNRNPMRYRGGLTGGTWLVSLISDLGNGTFDGANLVAGFEDLNPANTYWKKFYHLYNRIDTERRRFLDFERWWNGYFFMTGREIRFIVKNLFIDNRVERGGLVLENGRRIDLKSLEDPVVVLASKGDNITPPQQALNWIYKTYASVDGIRQSGQVIVYRIHEDIGHLGIFVSGRVARKEHRNIIETIDLTELLAPGLYEMVLEEGTVKAGIHDFDVRFEERSMEDLLAYDDGLADEAAFLPVAALSEFFDGVYRTFASPLVRAYTNEWTAHTLRELHPLRISRTYFSDLNPLMWPVKAVAPAVNTLRRPIGEDNALGLIEAGVSDTVAASLDFYSHLRDATAELFLKMMYDNPVMKVLFPSPDSSGGGADPVCGRKAGSASRPDKQLAGMMTHGGFANAAVRIVVAVAGADRVIHRSELEAYLRVLKSNRRLHWMNRERLRKMIKTQSVLIQADSDRAILSLADLLPTAEQRREAMEIARAIAAADRQSSAGEAMLLGQIRSTLKFD